VASVRSCKKLSPCLVEPMPAGSRMDPPLAKAKSSSDGGCTSVTTYSRKGKNLRGNGSLRERSQTMGEKKLCRHEGQ